MGFFEKLLREMAGGRSLGLLSGIIWGAIIAGGHGYLPHSGQPSAKVPAIAHRALSAVACPIQGRVSVSRRGTSLLPATCANRNASLAPCVKFSSSCGRAQQS